MYSAQSKYFIIVSMYSFKSAYLNCITTNSCIGFLMPRPHHDSNVALLPVISKADAHVTE